MSDEKLIATSDSPKADGFLLSGDLMFISKVTGTAAALGFKVMVIGAIADLAAGLQTNRPRALFVDLNCPQFEPAAVIAQLNLQGEQAESQHGLSRPIVIAFGSHVDEAGLERAKSAGCNEVLPRSRFSSSLPELLRRTLRPDP